MRERPLATLDLELVRHSDGEQVTDRRRDDVIVVLVVIVVL